MSLSAENPVYTTRIRNVPAAIVRSVEEAHGNVPTASLSTVAPLLEFGREVEGRLKETIFSALWVNRISVFFGSGSRRRPWFLTESVSFVGNVNRRCNVGAVFRASGVEGAVRLAMVMEPIYES